jgi:hypothetical protein
MTVSVLKVHGVSDANVGLMSDQWSLRLLARNLSGQYVYINVTLGKQRVERVYEQV